MKRQTKRRIMALVMAALMVVGLIPTGFAAKAVIHLMHQQKQL